MADLLLTLDLNQRFLSFFLEENRKNEQRKRRHPRQRGCLISSAPQGAVEPAINGFLQLLPEKLVFEPFELALYAGT